jgi:hypothetical protein
MADNQNVPQAPFGSVAQRVVREIGISQAEARDLVFLLGANWSSLLREGRLLIRNR